jgi:hypothetical protein
MAVALLAKAQEQPQNGLVQFSGMTLDGSSKDLIPVSYTSVAIKGANRGTYSDWKGFFSIVARKGETVVFSAIGYETVEFVIPDTLKDSRYSLVQLMTQDVVNLPETVVFPWPSREHFKLEFLAMDVKDELKDRADNNMSEKVLADIRKNTPMDGRENSAYYLRQQAQSYYYIGQTRPMNIFNPIAWQQFFQAWKSGKFKKKE